MENLQISIPITVAAALFAVTALWITISKLRSVDFGTVVDWVPLNTGCCRRRRLQAMAWPDLGQPTVKRISNKVRKEGPMSTAYPFTGASATGRSSNRRAY